MDMQQKPLAGMTSTVTHGDKTFVEVVNFTPEGEHLGLSTLWIDELAVGQAWVDLDADKATVYTHINGMTFDEWADEEDAAAAAQGYAKF